MADNSLHIKRVTLVDAVVKQMVDAIQSGRFTEGEKIPSEKMLTQEFGVSRTTLREAFKRLEYLGVLSIKQGDGTYITDANAALSETENLPSESTSSESEVPASSPANAFGPTFSENSAVEEAIRSMFMIGNYQLSHYIEARDCIEKEALRLAAERMEERDIPAIEENLRKQQVCTSPEEYARLDYEFHAMLIMLSKNEFLYQFWTAISPFVKEQIARSSTIDGVIRHSCSYHKKIFQALKNKDPKKAYNLNADHLRLLQGRMLSEASKKVTLSKS